MFISTKLRTKYIVILVQLFIIGVFSVAHAQVSSFKDTIFQNSSAVDELVTYSCKDSIFTDVKLKQVHLYGHAIVQSSDFKMEAGYIFIDLAKKEITAKYQLDSLGKKQNLPKFNNEGEEIIAQTIRYNFETKKGYIEELALKQEEVYLYMGTAKRHEDEQIHFVKGRFTTCDLPDPHYHFQLSRAVLIPEKRIVTGPMNLYVMGLSTPIGLPFSVIPQQKKRTHGILIPQFVPTSTYGFGLQDLGYYLPISPKLQSTVYASIFSRGSYGFRNVLDYKWLYHNTGQLDLGFQRFNTGFPYEQKTNKFSLMWRHTKDPKSNPYIQFGANVNFISDNKATNYLDPLNTQYFNSNFNSDVFLNRLFPGKPINMGMKLSMRQNAASHQVGLTSPVFNLNVTRVFPFKRLISNQRGMLGMISRIGVTYNLESQNRAVFKDDKLRLDSLSTIASSFMTGAQQLMTIQTTGSIFKNALKITPSIQVTNKLNLQQIQKSYNQTSNTVQVDTLKKFGSTLDLSANIQITSAIYSYFKFVGKRKPVLRYIATPSMVFRYTPQVNQQEQYFNPLQNQWVSYSPFEHALYASSMYKSGSVLDFSLNNTFELKALKNIDSISYVKYRLIDQLSLNARYDFEKDSMQLSDFTINLRLTPFKALSIVSSGQFSPYGWNEQTGKSIDVYALNNMQGLGRFLSATISTTYTITSKAGEELLRQAQSIQATTWNAEYNNFLLHPEYWINYNIPWKLNVSHVYGILLDQTNYTNQQNVYVNTNSLMLVADASFSKNWKVTTDAKIDLPTKRMVNLRVGLNRNLHCWNLQFNWVPVGGNKSFLITLRNSSSLFRDAKVDIRKPPVIK